jgi:hypothetical protein
VRPTLSPARRLSACCEADLGLARIVGVDVGRAVADAPIAVAQGGSELEPLAGRVRMDGLQLLQDRRAWPR